MTSTETDWALGETRGDLARTTNVEYDNTIKAGDGLKVTGQNSDGLDIVQKHTGKVTCQYVAMYDGKDGEIHEVLVEGPVKVNFGGNVPIGAVIAPKAAEFIAFAANAAAGPSCGYNGGSPRIDNDTGRIYFMGPSGVAGSG